MSAAAVKPNATSVLQSEHGHCADQADAVSFFDKDDVTIKQFFYLKNSGTRDLVMDVEGESRAAGTPVILWDQKFGKDHSVDRLLNQLWYEHTPTSTIRTALNDFCLDVCG